MLLWLLTTSIVGARECPGVNEALRELQTQVVEIRLEAARETLSSMDQAFNCGSPISRPDLAQLWMLEAMVEIFSNEQEAALEPLTAALRMNPELVVSDFGPAATAALQTARERKREMGVLTLANVPDGALIWIDGQTAGVKTELSAGLHLLQIADETPEAHFGRLIFVAERQTVTFPVPAIEYRFADQQAPTAPSQPEAQVQSVEVPNPARRGHPWLAIGAQGGAGTPQSGLDSSGAIREEPAFKLGIPIEVGILWRATDTTWLRATATGQPLLDGEYLFQGTNAVGAWPMTIGATVAAGLKQGSIDFGLGSGVALPSRIPIYGLARLPLGSSPVGLEGRIGTHLVSGRPTEPIAALLLHWNPRAGDSP